VLLSRLPYDKNLRRRGRHRRLRRARIRRDHARHARRFASDGDEYYPLIWEAPDGYDAVSGRPASLRRWPGRHDGPVYLGATSRSPHAAAASQAVSFPASAPADFHQCWIYHTGGAFELGWQIPYAILMARDTIARKGLTKKLLPELERLLAPAPTPWAPPLTDEAYRRLPLMAWGKQLMPVARYHGLSAHPEDGALWWQINVERRHGSRRAHVPRDLLVRHLPARRYRQLLRTPPPGHERRRGPRRSS
jgi:hypothetical protein